MENAYSHTSRKLCPTCYSQLDKRFLHATTKSLVPVCGGWQLHKQDFLQNIDVHVNFEQDLFFSTFETKGTTGHTHAHTMALLVCTQDLVENCHTPQNGPSVNFTSLTALFSQLMACTYEFVSIA